MRLVRWFLRRREARRDAESLLIWERVRDAL